MAPTGSDGPARALVPPFLLAAFADAAGQLMAERRDRTRRRLLSCDAVLADLGTYRVLGDAPTAAALGRLLDQAETTAARAVERICAGAFPPRGTDRASLAVVLAVQLVLGRRHRAEAARAAALVGGVIATTIEELEAAHAGDGEETAEADPSAVPVGGPSSGEAPRARAGAALVLEEPPVRCSLAPVPALAAQLARRTWQLVRFPAPVLLTSDSPVVLWAPPARAKPHQVGLGAADEVRVPLDPQHALIVARRAPAGEIVREVGERQARALNRTVAEAAVEWMYYHPASDPLEGVELLSPEEP
jgi:hypothetical protein